MKNKFFLLLTGLLAENENPPDVWNKIPGDYEYFLAKSTFAEEDKKTDLIQFYFQVKTPLQTHYSASSQPRFYAYP